MPSLAEDAIRKIEEGDEILLINAIDDE